MHEFSASKFIISNTKIEKRSDFQEDFTYTIFKRQIISLESADPNIVWLFLKVNTSTYICKFGFFFQKKQKLVKSKF